MSYRQKQSQNKPVIMSSTFCGALNDPHHKKEDKVVPMVDLYNQIMGGVDSYDQVTCYYTCERKSKLWSKKVVLNLLSRVLIN